MTDKQRNVSKIFKTFGTLRPHVAAKRMGYKESAPIMQQIKFLEKNGILEKKGKGRNTTYTFIQKK